MLLNIGLFCINNIGSIFSRIFEMLEKYPVTTKVIIGLLSGLFAIVTGLILKSRIDVIKKRQIAMEFFYPKLRIQINDLKSLFASNDMLNVSDKKSNYGNIFTPMYTLDEQHHYCENFNVEKFEKELIAYKEKCKEIMELIRESGDCNVPPKRTSKGEWFNNQQSLVSFCKYVESINGHRGNMSMGTVTDGKPLHISRCEEVLKMFDFFSDKLPQD